jgi:putative NADH-flavin reductase
MNVVVLGASGGCGQQLVVQALARGHGVKAVVRSPEYVAPAGVETLRGDLTDATFLRRAVFGADAVFSALGLRVKGIAPWNRPEVPDFLSKSTPALIEAMGSAGVRRLLAISAGGVGDSFERVPAFFRVFIKASALKYAYAELDVMEKLLLQSGLDVCIPRPTGLTDGPRTGTAKVCQQLRGQATISRADVASWMLDAAEKPAFAERTPMITVTGAG